MERTQRTTETASAERTGPGSRGRRSVMALTLLLMLTAPSTVIAVDRPEREPSAVRETPSSRRLEVTDRAAAPDRPDRTADHVGGLAARLRDHRGEVVPGNLYLLMATVGSDARARLYETTPFEHDGGPHADTNAANTEAAELAATIAGAASERIEFTTAPGGGPSGGLVYTIAYLNVLTDGEFTGDLRIAATGAVGDEGYFEMVQAIDEKLGAADLADVDVLLTPSTPSTPRIETHADRKVGERYRRRDGATPIAIERGLADYERWGATRPDGLDLVVVGHISDVAAYLCGTGSTIACTFAESLGRDVTSDPLANGAFLATPDTSNEPVVAVTAVGTIG